MDISDTIATNKFLNGKVCHVEEIPVDNKIKIDYTVPVGKKVVITFKNKAKVELHPNGKIVYPKFVSYKANSDAKFDLGDDKTLKREEEVSFISKTIN